MEKINVLLADDYMFIREGLRALLELEADIAVVGEAETGLEAVQLTRRFLPDVVIMDIGMSVLNGPEATRQIKQMLPHVQVLALSAYSDDRFVRQMAEAGASGYLLKQGSSAEVIKAVREAKRGRVYFSQAIAVRLAASDRERFLNGNATPRCPNKLTPREAEVLQMIADGYATKEIASELCVSTGTVIKQRQQVMNKLNLHNIATLTRYAVAEGMVKGAPRRDSRSTAYTPVRLPNSAGRLAAKRVENEGFTPFNRLAPKTTIYPARCND